MCLHCLDSRFKLQSLAKNDGLYRVRIPIKSGDKMEYVESFVVDMVEPFDFGSILSPPRIVARQKRGFAGGAWHEMQEVSREVSKLHQSNVPVSEIKKPCVIHVNNYKLNRLLYDMRVWVEGECAYRINGEREIVERYLGLPDEWMRRHQLKNTNPKFGSSQCQIKTEILCIIKSDLIRH